ncbi:Protein of unknown function [Pyronema omphalodes CBS 100304]|uniref:Uncharacterized protein n=1 Tax=Pyronema omphalodes (strain CBS 100304) TaxID=1076935 RepID=U4LW76_PYROM|nr:Protein of unknown function [Pyronema omphalodes CBS 100304]
MPRVIYSQPKPANAPQRVLAPRTNLPQATKALRHIPAKSPRHILTKCPHSDPTHRVSKAPRNRVPTKVPRDRSLHLQLLASNGHGKVPAKYHGMVKLPPPRRNPVRGVRNMQHVQQAQESEESEDLEAESMRPFYEQYEPEPEPQHESDTVSEDSEMDDVDEEQSSDSDSDDEDEPGRIHFLNQLQQFRTELWKRSLKAERVWRELVEEADRQDAWESYEENVFVFWIGGNHGHIVTVEEIERITQKNRRLANEFWWMWGN